MFYPPRASQSDGVFAVRWKQYKAHFIIQGLSNNSQIRKHFINNYVPFIGITYPDAVCRGNYSKTVLDTPLLYDLHIDPGEMYPLNIEARQNVEVIQKIKTVSFLAALRKSCNMQTLFQMKSDFDAKMVWGKSQMARGSSSDAEPCAKPGCNPFPTCCSTSNSRYTALSDLMGQL